MNKHREYAYSKSRGFDVHVMVREGIYAMVRRADNPHGMPFVLTNADLATLPPQPQPRTEMEDSDVQ